MSQEAPKVSQEAEADFRRSVRSVDPHLRLLGVLRHHQADSHADNLSKEPSLRLLGIRRHLQQQHQRRLT